MSSIHFEREGVARSDEGSSNASHQSDSDLPAYGVAPTAPALASASRWLGQRFASGVLARFRFSLAHVGRQHREQTGDLQDLRTADLQGLASFREVAESVRDVFWVYEPQSRRFLYLSPAYREEWRLDSTALYANSREWLRRVHRDDRMFVQQAFGRLARAEGYALEYRATLGSDKEHWIAERAFPVARRRGEVLHIAGVSQDITARKLAEQELSQTETRKEEFMATLAHELRGPLQPIRAAADVLARLHAEGSSMEKGATHIIRRQVNQLSQIVDDLLDFSRMARGKVQLRSETVRIEDVIGAAVDANRSLAESNRVAFRVQLLQHDAHITGDSTRLIQVFSNLLHNAVKFSLPGGTVWVSGGCDAANHQLKVSVRDEGAGIAADRLDSIFDLFVQGPPDPTYRHGGLGIGLSVVRSLTAMHGGTVSVRSDGAGRGSEFVVALPAR